MTEKEQLWYLIDKLIEKELLTIPNQLVRERCVQYLKEEVNGKRDFRF